MVKLCKGVHQNMFLLEWIDYLLYYWLYRMYCQLPIAGCLLPIACCLLHIAYCLLPIAGGPLRTFFFLLLLPIVHCLGHLNGSHHGSSNMTRKASTGKKQF